jgi:hypothetical protein
MKSVIKINLKNFPKKDSNKKNEDQIWMKKKHGGWNCKQKLS